MTRYQTCTHTMALMHYGARRITFDRAARLRKQETYAEKILWQRLSNKQMGVKFRRQHPLHCFIADFYCHELKLVIEVDGAIHHLPENIRYDKWRSNIFKQFGVSVVRFENEEILGNIDSVIGELHTITNMHRFISSNHFEPPLFYY